VFLWGIRGLKDGFYWRVAENCEGSLKAAERGIEGVEEILLMSALWF